MKRLPLIPLSPLIQTSREYAKVLAQITKSLSEEHSAAVKTVLEKNLGKERDKLDRLTKSMQSIQSSCLADLNVYDIAKEIAYIDCNLFRMVVLNRTWLCNFDKQSNIIPLLDFHRYLSHSFAHQAIYGDPKRKSVTQLIQLAYILMHIYRDFSGCAAVLSSLHISEVRRLQSMWDVCPSKWIQAYVEMVAILSPDNDYKAYYHQLWLHTQRFQDVTPSRSQMIAVPFMHAHLSSLQNLIRTHASSHQNMSDVVLSDMGQSLLDSSICLLEFCQQFAKLEPQEFNKYAIPPDLSRSMSSHSTILSTNSKRQSTGPKSIKLTISPCLELDLLRSDHTTYHWLVSRAYLTRSQLHCESLHVEPLAVGEIDLESEEEHDMYWDFFQKDILKEIAATKQASGESSTALKSAHKKPKSSTGNSVDSLVITESVSRAPAVKADAVISDPTTQMTADTVEQQQQQQQQQQQEEEEDTKETHDTLQPNAFQHGSSTIASSKRSSSHSVYVNEDVDANIVTQADAAKHENTQQKKMEQVDTASLNSASLPEAPVSAPNQIESASNKEEEEEKEDETEDEDDDEDSVIIIAEEEQPPTEEEEDEEWTGYPLDSASSHNAGDKESKEEEWTGYPLEDDEDEDDEIWRGYPVLQDERQDSASLIEISSPSTPQEHEEGEEREEEMEGNDNQEEWRGYQTTSQELVDSSHHQEAAESSTADSAILLDEQNFPPLSTWSHGQHHQLHAIGKAAARRMQYSISNTDTNRKRLPSSFAPSAST